MTTGMYTRTTRKLNSGLELPGFWVKPQIQRATRISHSTYAISGNMEYVLLPLLGIPYGLPTFVPQFCPGLLPILPPCIPGSTITRTNVLALVGLPQRIAGCIAQKMRQL